MLHLKANALAQLKRSGCVWVMDLREYALIGGFALGAHGIHRATNDI